MAELSLADMAARWKRDLFTNVIPFWEKHSLDREHGGYFTCLDRDGDRRAQAVVADHRGALRVHARARPKRRRR